MYTNARHPLYGTYIADGEVFDESDGLNVDGAEDSEIGEEATVNVGGARSSSRTVRMAEFQGLMKVQKAVSEEEIKKGATKVKMTRIWSPK